MEAANAYKQESRDKLILDHLGQVKQIVQRLQVGLPDHVDRENLEAAGILGLVEAAQSFDPTRGVKFSTFAFHRVRGAVLDELRRNCPLPQQVIERWNQIREAMQALGEFHSLEELAARCELTVDQVQECLTAIQLTRPEEWREEMVADQTTHSDLEREELVSLLADAIEELDERSRIVVTLYYQEGLTLREIGEVIDLSESRVSRVLNEACIKIRFSMNQ